VSVKNPTTPEATIPWTGKQIGAKVKAAIQRKELWVTHYREAMQYITPQRETFYRHTPGEKKARQQFDNTAMEAIQVFASRIMSTITPSWQTWSEFRAGSDIPEDAKSDIDKQLSEANKILFDFINHSNFTTQATETYLDIGYGTGGMIVEEGDLEDLLVFTNIPLSQLYLEEGPDSAVRSVYRIMNPLASNLRTMFPNGNFSKGVEDLITKESDSRIEIVTGSMFDPKSKLHFQIVLEKGENHLVQHHTEKTSPYIIPRWSVIPGEIYGRGPAIDMLPTVKTLNKMTEFNLKHAAMAVSGAYTAVTDGVINPYNVKIQPNTVIPVKAPDSLQPLPMAGSPDFSQFVRSELREDIKKAFFADPMPSFDDPVRTATEISIRNSNMLKNSGAQLGRLKSEWIEPIIERCVDILQRTGKLPPISVDGRQVTIKHTSPLAKIEDQEDLLGFNDFISTMERLEPHSPGLMALTTKLEDVPSFLAAKYGGFETLIRTKTESEQAAQTVMDTGESLAAGVGEVENVV